MNESKLNPKERENYRHYHRPGNLQTMKVPLNVVCISHGETVAHKMSKALGGIMVNTWTDVFFKRFGGWSCNAKGGDFGCVMKTGDRSQPFCSHSKACMVWLLKRGFIKTTNELETRNYLEMIQVEN